MLLELQDNLLLGPEDLSAEAEGDEGTCIKEWVLQL